MRNREIANGAGTVCIVLSMVAAIIVCLLVVAFGGGVGGVAAVGAIGMIVTAALELVGRRCGGGGAGRDSG